MMAITTDDSAQHQNRHSAHGVGSDGFVTSMARCVPSQQLQHAIVENPTDRTPTASGHAALVVSLPPRQTVPFSPAAVGDVLAAVLPLAAFRRPARPQPLSTERSRRSAALAAIGAWRRAHPDAPFEQDLAAAERINLEFGIR